MLGVDHDKIILLSTPFPTIPILGKNCCYNVIVFFVVLYCIVLYCMCAHNYESSDWIRSNTIHGCLWLHPVLNSDSTHWRKVVSEASVCASQRQLWCPRQMIDNDAVCIHACPYAYVVYMNACVHVCMCGFIITYLFLRVHVRLDMCTTYLTRFNNIFRRHLRWQQTWRLVVQQITDKT